MVDIPALVLKPHGNTDGDDDYIIVDASPFKVGRHPDSNRQMFRPDVSGCHAVFTWEDGHWWVQDNKSTNGTFINGKGMSEKYCLNIGDVVHFATAGYQVVPTAERDEEVVSTTVLADSADIQGMVDLLKIVNEQRTYPHYQPIIEFATGRVVGWESLGRGAASDGPMQPGRLFRLAATSRVESRLSERFRESCSDCVACNHCWPSDENMYMWVNLHPAEINDAAFLRSLEEFSRSELSQRYRIVLEMPETWVNNTDDMQVLVKRVRDLGLLVAYDDFGAGQSRIPDLITVPPDFLKLDRQLVAGIGSHKVKRDLVQAIVDACRELNVVTLGEGIETEEERQACIDMKIELGQGYLLCRPKPAYDLFSVERTTLPARCPFVKLNLLPR